VSPKEILLEWKRDNSSAPDYRLEVCDRLATGPDMFFAWPSLLAAGAKPLQIFGMVIDCLRETAQDVGRLSTKAERQSLDDVASAVDQLLDAISRAPQLNAVVPFVDLGFPTSAPVALAWTDRADDAMETNGIYSVNLPSLLRLLKSRCAEKLPTNAIARQTGGIDKSRVRAFVRRLAARLISEFGSEMHENLSMIACAVFQLEDPITGRDVERILRDSPFGN